MGAGEHGQRDAECFTEIASPCRQCMPVRYASALINPLTRDLMQRNPVAYAKAEDVVGQQSSAEHPPAGRGTAHQRDVLVEQGKHRLLCALDSLYRSVQTEVPDSVMHGELQIVSAALTEFKQARANDRVAKVWLIAHR